ncbi:Flagellar hook protein flgE [Rickettsiales bacterium Ac37b]|nr:Flagellar hook protein flgE [Rickettsiales bacterium Ac37b]
MSIYNAILAAKSGLDGQSRAVNTVSNNIANINTDAYKRGETIFSTLITSAGSTTGSSNGGVLATDRQLVDQEGIIKSTRIGTDLAVSGEGFFVVSKTPDVTTGNGEYLYTRVGSFRKDNQGNYVNSAGYYLLAWPLDTQGRLPGDTGNTNTVSSALLQSLQPVNLSTFTGSASATTQVNVGANLTSSKAAFKGNGVSIRMPSFGNNAHIDAEAIIDIDNSGTSALNSGDYLRFTPDGLNFSYDFYYDGVQGSDVPSGIVRSNVINSVTPILGADSPTRVFNTGVVAGDSFSISNEASGTVTFTFVANSPNTLVGEFNSLSSLANAIKQTKGLTARINSADNQLLISALDGNESLTFTNNQGSFVTALGLTNTLAAPNNNRFTTLSGLLNLAKSATGLNGSLTGSSNDVLEITSSNPLGNLRVEAISGGQVNTGSISSPYSIASEFGISTTLGLTDTIPNSGRGVTLDVLPTSNNNNGILPRDVIDIDNSGFNVLNSGDALSFLSSADGMVAVDLTYDGIARSNEAAVATPIMGATNGTDVFTAGIADGDTVTITVNAIPYTFTFQTAAPNPALGQFNSMATLASAINTLPASQAVLSARVNAANNRLLVTPLDGTQAMTFTDSVAGAVTGALGLNNTIAQPDRFTTLQGLVDLINASTATSGLQAEIVDNKINITPVDEEPVVVSASATAVGIGNSGGTSTEASIFGELGISINNGKQLIPSYDPTGANAPNMASGRITPHFSRNTRIYDAFGIGHDFRISFLKTSPNEWAIEIYSLHPEELTNMSNEFGQIAYGTVRFNGEGTLASVSTSLQNPINITWANQAINSSITFNWGTAGIPASSAASNTNVVIGKADGLSQLDSAFSVSFVNQDGFEVGQLSGINIDHTGLVYANFSNGTSKAVFRVPLAIFANPNGLSAYAGNAYGQTNLSGEFNLKEIGSGGTGTLTPAALEQSNVDLSEELTRAIIIQRGYQSNAQVIRVSDSMLEDLSRIIV